MTAPGTPVDHRPRTLRLICLGLATLVVLVFGLLALLLRQGTTDGQTYTVGDQIAFFGLGLLIAAGALVFTRFRVRGDVRGIWIRNALGERFFPWEVVAAVDLPLGGTWAQVELKDDDTIAILAIQTSDGDVAIDALIGLRRLLRESRGE